MSDQDFRTWLKNRLATIDDHVKAPNQLKERIRAALNESDQAEDEG